MDIEALFRDARKFLEVQKIPDKKAMYFTDSDGRRKLVVDQRIYDAMSLYLGESRASKKYIAKQKINQINNNKNETKA